MRKLTLLLIAAIFCLPARGEIVVYNTVDVSESAQFNAIADVNDPLTGEWVREKGQDKSFMVFDVNYSDPNVVSFDSIKTVKYWRDTDAIDPATNPKGLLYYVRDVTDRCHLIYFVQDGQVTAWLIKYTSVSDGAFGIITGTVKTIDIGLGSENKRAVAPSIKGWILNESTDEGTSAGNDITQDKTTMSLNAAWTKKANNSDITKGFNKDMGSFLDADSSSPQGLVNWLEAKGYKLSI